MIYVVCGPTGSGKTEAALKLAHFFKCPIINADAFQIYKDMDIGTAKISKNDPDYKNHFLLDIVTPEESFSVKQFQDIFRKTLNELLTKYKDVVVCGGTGLYIKASFFDFDFEEENNLDVSDLEKLSNDELWDMLVKLDKNSTISIHKNNRKRVIRAISIARNHKTTKSESIEKQSHELIYKNVTFLMINPNREILYQNINKRVDKMICEGLVDEVKNLLNKYKLSLTSKQAIGYKEIISYLNEEISLENAIELIKQRTRNYAKRQLTYFNHQLETVKFENVDALAKEIIG